MEEQAPQEAIEIQNEPTVQNETTVGNETTETKVQEETTVQEVATVQEVQETTVQQETYETYDGYGEVEDEGGEEGEEEEALFGEDMDEGEVDELLDQISGFSMEDIEELINKNTASFRCLAQIIISRSSLLRHILYPFPPLVDPGIDDAFNYVEPEVTYDDIGCEKYKNLCKDFQIVPISRILRSLPTDTLNLKYYGLSLKQIKALCTTLMLNAHIKTLILQDNWMSPEAVFWIGEMLRENNSIQVLSLRECRIGQEGAQNIQEGLSLNMCLRELDLSFNGLGNEGLETVMAALKDNQLIQKLNLAHNNLGDPAAKCLGAFLAENLSIEHLDLGWNDMYTTQAMKDLCKGLEQNKVMKHLDLSWNAISDPLAIGKIVKYLKTTETLEHLDLSSNRLMGKCLKMIKTGILKNDTLKSVKLGFNLITPAEAMTLVNTFVATKDEPLKLQSMDLENVFVNKNFVPLWKRVGGMGKEVKIEGVLSNWTIEGPEPKALLFKRCRFLAQKPKKKKQKKDFGHFIYSLPDENMDKKEFVLRFKKFKLKKLDQDLIAEIARVYRYKKTDLVVLKQFKEDYLAKYPESEPAPPKKKKAKKGKGKKGKDKKKADESTEAEQYQTTEATRTSLLAQSSRFTDIMKSMPNIAEVLQAASTGNMRSLVRFSVQVDAATVVPETSGIIQYPQEGTASGTQTGQEQRTSESMTARFEAIGEKARSHSKMMSAVALSRVASGQQSGGVSRVSFAKTPDQVAED